MDLPGLTKCTFNVGAATAIAVLLYLMTGILVIKEFFQLAKNKLRYIFNLANCGQWVLFIVFVITAIPAFQSEGDIDPWQLNVAAVSILNQLIFIIFIGNSRCSYEVCKLQFGIFLAWVLILRDIGKLPDLGIYSAILRKVICYLQ